VFIVVAAAVIGALSCVPDSVALLQAPFVAEAAFLGAMMGRNKVGSLLLVVEQSFEHKLKIVY